jgi:hypothetical protein
MNHKAVNSSTSGILKIYAFLEDDFTANKPVTKSCILDY